MSKRRSHSSIDNLPSRLQDVCRRMVVDGLWPPDCPRVCEGRPTYDHIVEYCSFNGHSISRSAVGRWAKGLRAIERMATAGLIARQTMANMTGEDAPKTQKAAAEMMTALLLDFMVSDDDYSSKQLKEISQAIRDCAQVSINADKYIRTQIAEKVKEADSRITKIVAKKKIDPDVLKQIREEVYGIIK